MRTPWDSGGANRKAGAWLTGGDANCCGVVGPSHPFAPGKGGWGACERVGRYGERDVDDATFPLFADPVSSASNAKTWVLGVNWYLTGYLKRVANCLSTALEGSAAADADREDGKAVFARLQVAF